MASFLTYSHLDSFPEVFSEVSQDGTPPLNSRPESGEIVDSDSSENKRVSTSGAPRTGSAADGYSRSPPLMANHPATIPSHRPSHPKKERGAGRRGTDRVHNDEHRSNSRRRGRSMTRTRYRGRSTSRGNRRSPSLNKGRRRSRNRSGSRRSASRERRRRPPRSRSRDRRRSSSSRSRSSSPREIRRRYIPRRSRSRSRRRVRNRSRSRQRRSRSSSRGSPCRRGRSRSVRARGSSKRLSRSHSSSQERRLPPLSSLKSGLKTALFENFSEQPGLIDAFVENTNTSARRTSTSVAGTPNVAPPDGYPDLPSKESLLKLIRNAGDTLRSQTSNVAREPKNSSDAFGQGQTGVEHSSGTEDDDSGGSSPEIVAYEKPLRPRAVGSVAKFGDKGSASQDVTVQSRRVARPFCEIREGVKKTGCDSGFRSRNASASAFDSHQDNGTQRHGTPRSRTDMGPILDAKSTEEVVSFIAELENFSAPLATTARNSCQSGATTAGGNGQTGPTKIWPPPPPSPSDDPKKFALRKRLNDILTQVFKHTEQTSGNGCVGSRVDSSEPVPRAGQEKPASAGNEPISFTSHQLTQIKQLTSDISQARKKPSVPLADISSSDEASPLEPNLMPPSDAEASLPAVRDGQQSASTVSVAGTSPSSVPRDPRKRPAGRRSPQVREDRNDPAVNDVCLPARLNKKVPPAPTLKGMGLYGTESRPQNPPTLPGSSHGPLLQHQFLPSGPLPFNGHVPVANQGGFPQHQPPSHMVGFGYGPRVPFMPPCHSLASPMGSGGVMVNHSFHHGPQYPSNFNHNLPHHSNFNSAPVLPTVVPGMMHGHHPAPSQGFQAPTNFVAEPQQPVRPHPVPPFNAPPNPPAVASDQTRTRDSSQESPRDPRLKLHRQPAPPAPPPSKPKQPPKKSEVWGRKKPTVSAEFAPPKQSERASSQRCKPLVHFKIPKIRPSRVDDGAQTDLALPMDREAETMSEQVLDAIKAAEEYEQQTKEKVEEERRRAEEKKAKEEEERKAEEERERLAELGRKVEEERKQQEALATKLEQERRRQEEEKTIEEEQCTEERERKLHEELVSLAKAQTKKCQEMEDAAHEEAFDHHSTNPEVIVLDDSEADVDANERDVIGNFLARDPDDAIVISEDDGIPEPFETDEEDVVIVKDTTKASISEEGIQDSAPASHRRSTRMSKKDMEKETTEKRLSESKNKVANQAAVDAVAGTSETVVEPLPKKRGRKSRKELQEIAERAAQQKAAAEKALQEEAGGIDEEVVLVCEEGSAMVGNVAQDLLNAAAKTTAVEAAAGAPSALADPLLPRLVRCEECSCEVEHLVHHYHMRHEGLDIPTAVPEVILKNLLKRRQELVPPANMQEAHLAPLDLSWIPEGEKFPVAVRCNICSAYSHTQRYRLIQHVQKSHGKTYLCILCPDRSSTYNVYPEFIDHLASVHTGEWLYECNLCHKKFGDAIAAKLHMQLGTHKDNQKAQCPRLRLCDGEEASNEVILYVCSVCGFCKLNRTLVDEHLEEMHAAGQGEEGRNGPCVLEFNAGVEFTKVKKEESTSGSKRGRKKKVSEAVSKATPKKVEAVPEASAPEVVPVGSAPEVVPEASAPEVVPEGSAPAVMPESIPKRNQESASTFLSAAAIETLEAGELEGISEVVASAEETPQCPGRNLNRRSMPKITTAPKTKTTVNEVSLAEEEVRPGQETSRDSPTSNELMPVVASNISPGAPSSGSHKTQSTSLVSVAVGGSGRPAVGPPRRVTSRRSRFGACDAVPRKIRSTIFKRPPLPTWKTEPEEGPVLKMKPYPAKFLNPWHSTDSKKSGAAWEVLLNDPGKLAHPFKCLGYHCSFTTTNASVFCAHIMMCHDQSIEDGSTGCMYCFTMFQHPAELTVHILEVHSHWNYRCSKCTGRFPNKTKASKHVAKHRGEDGTVLAVVVSREHEFKRGRFPVPSPAETMAAMRARPFVARIPARPLTFEKIWKMEYGDLYNMLKNPDLIPDLTRHEQLVPLFKCASYDCSFVASEEMSFMEHLDSHSTADALTCIYCLEIFHNKQELAAHVKQKHGACEYQCPECFYRCMTTGLLEHHKRMFHSSTSKTIPIRVQPVAEPDTSGSVTAAPYVCAFASCTFVVFDAVGFRNHFREKHAESRNFPCAQCGLDFGTPDELIKHSRKHGLQNIHCSLCSMAFASDEALQRHSALVHPCTFAGVTRRNKEPQPEKMKKSGSTSGEETLDPVTDHSSQLANTPGAVRNEPVKRGEFFVYPPGKDLYKCPRSLFKDACSEEFSTAAALRRHMKLCSMVGYWCPLCRTIRRRYTSAAEYFDHLAKDHTLESTLFLCGSCENTACDLSGIRRHWSREHAKDDGFGILTPVDSVDDANDFLKDDIQPEPRRPLGWGTDAAEWDGAMFVISGNKCDRKPISDVVDVNTNLDKVFHAMSVVPQPALCDHCPFQTRMVKNMAGHIALHRMVNSGDLPPDYCVFDADVSKFSSPPKKTKEELEWNKMRNLAFGAKEIGEDGSELPSIPTGQSIIKNMMYPRFVNSYMRYLCPSNYCLFVAKAFEDLDEHLRLEHPTTRTYRCRHCHPNADIPVPAGLLFDTVRDLWDHCELHGDTLVQCGGCHLVGTDSEVMGTHYLVVHQGFGPDMLDAGPLPVVDQKAMIVLREFNAGRWRAEDLGEVSEEKKDLAKKQEEERELNNAAKNKRRKRTANARPAEGGTSARFSQDPLRFIGTIQVAEEGSTAHLVPMDLNNAQNPEGTVEPPPADPAAHPLDETPGPSEVDEAMPSPQKKRKTLEKNPQEPALPAVEEAPAAAASGAPLVYDPSWKHVCDTCQERFASRGMLRAHQKSAHAQPVPGQTVPCSICGRKVVHRDDLKLHYAKYHPGLPLPSSGAPVLNMQAAAVSTGTQDGSELAGVNETKSKVNFKMMYACPESSCKAEEKFLYPEYIEHLTSAHGLKEPIHVSQVNKGRAGYSPSYPSDLEDSMVMCGVCSMRSQMKLVVEHILSVHTPSFMPFQFDIPVVIFKGKKAAINKPQSQPSSVPGPSVPQGNNSGRTSNSSDSSSVASSLASASLADFGVLSSEPRTARPSRDIDLGACAALEGPAVPKPSLSAAPPMKSQVFQCPECFVEKEFNAVQFRMHLKEHRPIWKCPLCEITFPFEEAASAHRYEFHAHASNFDLEASTAHQEWIESEFRKFMTELHPPGSPKNPSTPAARKRNAVPSTSMAPPKRGRHAPPVARKSSMPRYRSSEFQYEKLRRLSIYDHAVQSNGLPHEIDVKELVVPSGVVGALKRGTT